MRAAEARRQASTITSSSIRWSLAGGQVGCTMNTSRPRTFSMISTLTSPSLKRPTSRGPPAGAGGARSRARARDWRCRVNSASVSESTIRAFLCSRPIHHFSDRHWLGWKDSNLRMAGSKPAALPLGDTPANQLSQRSAAHAAASDPDRGLRSCSNSVRNPLRNAARASSFALEAGEDAAARYPSVARLPAQPCDRNCASSQSSAAATSRIARRTTGSQSLPGLVYGEKARIVMRRRISCQFRGLEDLGSTDGDSRVDHQKPPLAAGTWTAAAPRVPPPRRCTVDEHRHVRAQRQSESRRAHPAPIRAARAD